MPQQLQAGGAGADLDGMPAAAPSSSSSRLTSPHLLWDARKREVLQEFTVTGKLSVAASFAVEDASAEEDGAGAALDAAKAKLRQLDTLARGVPSVELTQAEYEKRLQKMQRDLTRAWAAQQRATSLRIVVSCSKLLAEPRAPQFYPSMFVLVCDLLDSFSRLVFDRLKAVAEEERARTSAGLLPADFSARDCGPEARDTASNWLLKVSCIGELVPRLYLELALLECYRFTAEPGEYGATVVRLSHSIRGIGDPLVAAYARWFLARQAGKLIRGADKARPALLQSLSDYLLIFGDCVPMSGGSVHQAQQGQQGQDGAAATLQAAATPLPLTSRQQAVAAQIEAAGLTLQQYLRLHAPAVSWLCHAAGWGAPREAFQVLLQQYRERCGCGIVLRCLMEGFDPSFFAPHLNGMLGLVKEAAVRPSDAATPQAALADLYTSLAGALARHPPPPAARLPFLNECWRAVTKVGDPVVFARHGANLMPLLLSAYSEREVLLLLGDLTRRLQAAAASGTSDSDSSYRPGSTALAPAGALPHLERLLTALVEAEVKRVSVSPRRAGQEGDDDGGGEGPGQPSQAPAPTPSFSGIITSEWFGRLLDLFASDAKPALCNRLLSALVSVPGKVTDPVVVNTMFEVARHVHDSVDILSPLPESTKAADLLSAFIDKVDFGRDLEKLLAFYTDCRLAFGGLDSVKERLVVAVVRLADLALGYTKGRHTARTAQFARAVFAAAATSIPGIEDPFSRMTLYIHASGSALSNACVSQADALLRSAILEIPELPANVATAAVLSAGGKLAGGEVKGAGIDSRLYALLRDFTRVAVSMPGHPDLGPLYLARGLLNALGKYPWSPTPVLSPWRVKCHVALLPLLAALGRAAEGSGGASAGPGSFALAPAAIPGVDGNDVLYAGDPSYPADIRALLVQVLGLIVQQLQEGAAAAGAGEPGARGVVMDGVSALCNTAQILEPLLAYDAHLAAPHLEAALKLLQGLAADHPVLKSAIPVIQAKRPRAV